jgi:Bacterial protein of unknown function (DUF885)
MTRARTIAAALAAACLAVPQAHAGAADAYDALQALAHDLTYQWAALHPLSATALGIGGEDGKLDTPSLATDRRDLALIRSWEHRLAAVDVAGAPLAVRDDALMLRAQLVGMERGYTLYRFDRKDYSAPGNAIINGIFTQFQYLPIAGQGGASTSDVVAAWADITSRLRAAPAYIAAAEQLVTEPGHLQGAVGSDELGGAPDFFNNALTAAAKEQVPPDAFARFASARDAALSAIKSEKAYIDAHVASWPENYVIGRHAYDAMLRDEQLLPYNAEDVEKMGADELAHGWAVTYWTQHVAQERGTPIGPETGGGLAPGGPALIPYYRDQIATLRKFVADHHVIDVPSWLGSINVVETPKFLQPVSPGASMNPPRQFAKETNGFYYITPPVSLADAAARLDPNEDFDRDRILSTAAHEAMPGHFVQLSIARRNPDLVRKIQSSGSFQEGWAFYGEEMFVVLGLYGEDLDARYYTAQWERVRGARAIADAKLASGEWSEPQAVTYYAAETGFGPDAAKAAVDGIALGPGNLMVYTVGRQQLELLMHDYFAKMGDKGSLEDFHDRLMCYGSSPFSIVAPELLADLTKPLAAVQAAAGAQQ